MTKPNGPTMTSSRPYLLRALYDWISDNCLTPQVLIDARHPEVQIPDHLRAEDRVVLNISAAAVRDLLIDNDALSFVARFSGVSQGVVVPLAAVLAIYARENGQGMMFPNVDDHDRTPDDEPGGSSGDGERTRSRTQLKIVK